MAATIHEVQPADTLADIVTAADPGDTIKLMDGAHAHPAILISKLLHFRGESRGGTVWTQATGHVLDFAAAAKSSTAANFTIDAVDNDSICLRFQCYDGYARNIRTLNGSIGIYVQRGGLIWNCETIGASTVGISITINGYYQGCWFSGAHKCTNQGIYGYSAVNYQSIHYCICTGNGVDMQKGGGDSSDCCGNTTEDGTALGVDAVTGMLTTDFENYAGNDFRIRAAVAATTKARHVAIPIIEVDAYGNARKASGVAFAGPHDPDPDIAAAPAAVSLVFTDQEDGTGSTAVVSGGDATATNTLQVLAEGESTPTEEHSAAGAYSHDVVRATGYYYGYVESVKAGLCTVTGPYRFRVTNSGAVTSPGLPTTFTVKKLGKSKTPTGGLRDDLVTVTSGVKGWAQEIEGKTAVAWQRRHQTVLHHVYMFTDPQCEAGYVLDDGTRKFRVIGQVDQAGLGEIYKVKAEELR